MPYKVGLPPEQRPPQLKGDSLISKKPVIVVSSGDQDPILTLQTDGIDIDTVDTEPETPTPETLAASVMAENTSEEVDRILKVWSELFGMRLNSERVRNQLAALREWHSRWMNGGNFS